jgi:hypothetical protein
VTAVRPALQQQARPPRSRRSQRYRNRLQQRLAHAGCLLPAGLTGHLWLKGLHPGLPGLSCPLLALTGIPCPTCFLTRATSAALSGDLGHSVELHAFGPLVAAALLWWSVIAIQQRRLLPQGLPAWPLGWGVASLVVYWLLRIGLSFGLGLHGFPGFVLA